MINISFDELRLIAQIRNISDYENKSRQDLIKALSQPKPDTKPKPEPQTPKPETPKLGVKTNQRKLRKLRKNFDELRHKFSKKRNRYRKTFYVAKNKKNIFLNQK